MAESAKVALAAILRVYMHTHIHTHIYYEAHTHTLHMCALVRYLRCVTS